MMPLFTSALKTLKSHEVARGSTLLNINQQIASSCGVAVMSVILHDNHLQASKLAGPAMATLHIPSLADNIPAAAITRGLEDVGERVRRHLLGGLVAGPADRHPGHVPASKAQKTHLSDDRAPRRSSCTDPTP